MAYGKPQTETKTLVMEDSDILKIQLEKDSALKFRERRHPDWNENYTLYRDRVITNRLTQRQTINVPLIKYGLATILKDIDDSPILYFDNIDNEEQKEVFYNEYWKETARANKLDIRDRIDKKQACLYGRSFKKLNIVNGKFTFEIVDPQDILVERHVDPADIDSARVVIQTGIFRPLREILENEDYNATTRRQLKAFYSETSPSEQGDDGGDSDRMSDMGLTDAKDPTVGETYIELNEVYRSEYDKTLKENIIMVYHVALTGSGMLKLYKKKLCDIIGETEDNFWYNHFPYTTWATDAEAVDFWSDGPADILRPANKVLNTWISQLSENRTLRNYNMHYYDASNANFIPQTFSPVPWGWYPTPGNPNELIRDVEVGDLSESLDEMQFVIGIAEKAVAATSAQAGEVEERQVTLGEIQIAVANAKDRVKSMQVFYNESWADFGLKYMKMIEGASHLLEEVKIVKKGRQGKKNYSKVLTPKMWLSKSGYKVQVKMKDDKQAEDINTLQKLDAVRAAMPDNIPLESVYKRKLLDFAGLTADEMKDVLDYENQKQEIPPDDMGMLPEEGAPPMQGEMLQQAPMQPGAPVMAQTM